MKEEKTMRVRSWVMYINSLLAISTTAFGQVNEKASSTSAATVIPVTESLDQPGCLTAVIDNADGIRVCNLASEVKARAGKLTLNWDLYDVGVQPGSERIKQGDREVDVLRPYVRRLVKPGTFWFGLATPEP